MSLPTLFRLALTVTLAGTFSVAAGCGGKVSGANRDGDGPGDGDAGTLPDAGGDGGDDAGPGDDDAGPGDEHPDDYIFETEAVRTFDLEIEQADWDWLNEHAAEELYVPGVLIFEGRRYEPVGVRYKGGFGALQSCFLGGIRTCDKMSMKVSLNEYAPEGRFHGLKKLQFHAMYRDPSQMRERLAYALFRELGVVAPRTVYALLRINGEPQGFFTLVEQIDGRFTRRHFEAEGGEGNLYKEVWPEHLTPETYLAALQTNEEIGDASRMVRFAQALADAPDGELLDVLGQWTDLGAFFRYIAVDRGLSHWDGIRAWYCGGEGPVCGNHNFYWYEAAAADRMWLVPWDMDHSFSPSPWETRYDVPGFWDAGGDCEPIQIFPGVYVRAPACDPFIDRLGTEGWDHYVEAAETLLDGPLFDGVLEARIDAYQRDIEAYVTADEHGPDMDDWLWGVNELRGNVATLRAELEEEVGR